MTKVPEVIPMTQISVDGDGNSVVRCVRPMTYALMTFVKVNMGMPDTIDISEDETRGSWTITVPVVPEADDKDDAGSLEVDIETYEEREFITLDIYLGSYELSKKQLAKLSDYILLINNRLIAGHFQLQDQSFVRYHASIDFKGVASPDRNYQGPHLVQPKLIENMFEFGLAAARRFYGELPAVLEGKR